MTEKTIIIENQNSKNWNPNQEGQRFKEFLDLIKKPEIVIIDNNSIDATLQIVRYFIQDPLLQNESKSDNYTKIKIKKMRTNLFS